LTGAAFSNSAPSVAGEHPYHCKLVAVGVGAGQASWRCCVLSAGWAVPVRLARLPEITNGNILIVLATVEGNLLDYV